MRHRKKIHHLGKAADQRKALLRSLVSSLFIHEQIQTTKPRAKALKEFSDEIITLAKRGDLHAIRQIKAKIYNQKTGQTMTDVNGKEIDETILRKLVRSIGPRFKDRQGGYTRIIQAPPRRGDNTTMAVVELVD